MQNSETRNQEIALSTFDAIDDFLEASTFSGNPDVVYAYHVVHGIMLLARNMMTPIFAYTRLDMVDFIKAHPDEVVPYIKAHSKEFAKYQPEKEN